MNASISVRWLLASVSLIFVPAAGVAANYPNRPITFVVPLAAGGGTDIISRALASEMAKDLGQPIVIENRPGASGSVGSAFVAHAKPDGYTAVVGTTGTHQNNQYLYKSLPYNPFTDFKAVNLICVFNNVVVVPVSSPIKTIAELVTAAKNSKQGLNYGIAAIGSSPHLAIELFKREANFSAQGIPYGGSAAAAPDLLSGRLDFMMDSILSDLANIRAGKLRPIATLGKERSPVLPDVPTVAEQGYPNFSAIGWVALFVPMNTPEDIVDKLSASIERVYAKGDLPKRFSVPGVDLVQMTRSEFNAFWKEEQTRWSKVIRDSNIQAD